MPFPDLHGNEAAYSGASEKESGGNEQGVEERNEEGAFAFAFAFRPSVECSSGPVASITFTISCSNLTRYSILGDVPVRSRNVPRTPMLLGLRGKRGPRATAQEYPYTVAPTSIAKLPRAASGVLSTLSETLDRKYRALPPRIGCRPSARQDFKV